MSLSTLIYEDIEATNKGRCFGRASYGNIGIIIMKETSFVNGTALAKLAKKEYCKWSILDMSKDLFKEVSEYRDIEINNLSIKVIGGSCEEIRGTYIHQDLVPGLASWMSPAFHFKICLILNDYFVKEHKLQLKAQRKAIKKANKKLLKKDKLIESKTTEIITKDEELVVKEDKIDTLLKEIKSRNVKIDEQLEELRKANDKLDEQNLYIKSILANTEEAKMELSDIKTDLSDTRYDYKEMYQNLDSKLEEANDKLDIALVQRVPPELDLGKVGCFILIRLKIPITYGGIDYLYYVVRGQTVNVQKIRDHKGVPILELNCNPNPANLYNRIKETLPHITYKYNCINTSLKESKLIKDITDLNSNKYVVEIPVKTKEEQLSKNTIPELVALCRVLGYRGYSTKKTKDDLITFMIGNGY